MFSHCTSASAKVLFNYTLCLTSPGTARLKQSEWGGLSEDVGEPCLGVMLTQNYPACLTKNFPGVGGSLTIQVSNTFLSCAVLIHSVVSNSATPWTVARQALLSMEILQARILEWVAMLSSRGSSQPKNWTQVSCIAGGSLQVGSLLSEPPRKSKNTGVSSPTPLQEIFPTRESNWDLLHCGQIL